MEPTALEQRWNQLDERWRAEDPNVDRLGGSVTAWYLRMLDADRTRLAHWHRVNLERYLDGNDRDVELVIAARMQRSWDHPSGLSAPHLVRAMAMGVPIAFFGGESSDSVVRTMVYRRGDPP